MHDSILLKSCTTPLKGRMQADFSLWQGQMGCDEMGFWSPSFHRAKGLGDIFFFFHTGPGLTQRAKYTTINHIYIRSLSYARPENELPFISCHIISNPFAIAAFWWTPCVITLVDMGRCSRMHLQIKPAPDKGACQQYGDRSDMCAWHV